MSEKRATASQPAPTRTERKIIVLEIEPGGAIPVRGMPGVVVWETPDFASVERAYGELRRMQDTGAVEFPNILVLDSITYLTDTTLADLAMDGKAGGLWVNRKPLINDKWAGYQAMTTLTTRLLMQYRALNAISIFICHEGDRESPDGTGIKRGPSLTPAVLKTIYGWSDVVTHLGKIPRPVETQAGKIPAGTRRLRLVEDDVYMAKARVPRELQPVKEVIVAPMLDDLLAAVKLPEQKSCRITLYGPPGSGKTTLSAGGYRPVEER